MNLQRKTALVTGATDGLGFSLAKELVSKGCKVYGIGRSNEKFSKAKNELKSPNFILRQCDVSDYDQIVKVVKQIGNIDILINNAGIWLEGQLQNLSPSQISDVVDINLKGVIYVARAVMPIMLKNNQGFIVNISSTSGLKGRPNQSVYAASKFGVTGFTKSLQEDLIKTNIKVAGFYPGGMSTRLFAKAGNPKENQDWMDTDKVAEVLVFMLERDDAMIMDHVVLNKRGTKTSN